MEISDFFLSTLIIPKHLYVCAQVEINLKLVKMFPHKKEKKQLFHNFSKTHFKDI